MYTILLVAVLSERTPFIPKRGNKVEEDSSDDEMTEDQAFEKKRKRALRESESVDLSLNKFSDAIARMRATGAYFYTKKSLLSKYKTATPELNSKLSEFCASNFLHQDTLERILDLQRQLKSLCVVIFDLPSLVASDDEALDPPSFAEEIALRQILM
jgi:hypothetical protein